MNCMASLPPFGLPDCAAADTQPRPRRCTSLFQSSLARQCKRHITPQGLPKWIRSTASRSCVTRCAPGRQTQRTTVTLLCAADSLSLQEVTP